MPATRTPFFPPDAAKTIHPQRRRIGKICRSGAPAPSKTARWQNRRRSIGRRWAKSGGAMRPGGGKEKKDRCDRRLAAGIRRLQRRHCRGTGRGLPSGGGSSRHCGLRRPSLIAVAFSTFTWDRISPTASPFIFENNSTAKRVSMFSIRPAAFCGFMAE